MKSTQYAITLLFKPPKCLFQLLFFSRLDYCNSLLSRYPQFFLNRLQKIENNVAHLILKASKTDHTTPHFHTLHWLPINARVKYKLCSYCFVAITSTVLSNLSFNLLKIYTPSRQLQSSDIHTLGILSVNTKSYSECSFAYTNSTLWNTFSNDIRFSHFFL